LQQRHTEIDGQVLQCWCAHLYTLQFQKNMYHATEKIYRKSMGAGC